jgi:hypothetical protein
VIKSPLISLVPCGNPARQSRYIISWEGILVKCFFSTIVLKTGLKSKNWIKSKNWNLISTVVLLYNLFDYATMTIVKSGARNKHSNSRRIIVKEITSTMQFRDKERNYFIVGHTLDIQVNHVRSFCYGDRESVFGNYPHVSLTFYDDSFVTLKIERGLLPSFLACLAHVRFTTWAESKAQMRRAVK